MLNNLNYRQSFFVVFAATLAVILGAWAFEYAGFPPCELCLKQRIAYYAVIPISLLLAILSDQNSRFLKNGMVVIALIMLASCIFGIYHSGVEWKFWAGPSTCTGEFAGGLPDLTKKAVMCDQPSIRIFGISLAGYNALISAAVSAFAFRKAYGSSSASQ